MNENNKTVCILGCGWLGLPLAEHLTGKGYSIKGSTAGDLELIKKAGIEAYFIHITGHNIEGDFPAFIQGADILIIGFPPARIPNIEEVHPRQMDLIIDKVPVHQKVIFISSTSVYQNNNSVVTEEAELYPEKASGIALMKAEQRLRDYFQDRLSVLRLAGLVGYDRLPGRSPTGKKEVKNRNEPINVIHRDDCIGLIEQLIEQEKWGELYNGCADEHPLRKEYYSKAAEKAGLIPPGFAEEEPVAYKIVSNEKSRRELGYIYKYPDPLKML